MLAAQSSPVSTTAFALVVLVTSTAIVAALAWTARRLMGSPVGALGADHRGEWTVSEEVRKRRRSRKTVGRPLSRPRPGRSGW